MLETITKTCEECHGEYYIVNHDKCFPCKFPEYRAELVKIDQEYKEIQEKRGKRKTFNYKAKEFALWMIFLWPVYFIICHYFGSTIFLIALGFMTLGQLFPVFVEYLMEKIG